MKLFSSLTQNQQRPGPAWMRALILMAGLCAGTQSFADSLRFDGVDDYAYSLANISETAGTIEMWFKTATPSSTLFIALAATNSHLTDRQIEITSAGQLMASIQGHSVTAASIVTDDVWHHVAFVYGPSEGGIKLYLDGTLRASNGAVSSSTVAQTLIEIGGIKNEVFSEGFFNGYLDEVRIWNVARTASQIAADWARATTADAPGLQFYWPLQPTSFLSTDTVDGKIVLYNANATLPMSQFSFLPFLVQVCGPSQFPSWMLGDAFANTTGTISGNISGASGPASGVTVALEYAPATIGTLQEVPWEATPDLTTTVSQIDYPDSNNPFWASGPVDKFGAKFEGQFNVLFGAGTYTWWLSSDDGAILEIDGVRVITRDGLRAFSESSGTINLTNGPHSIQVRYFEGLSSQGLKLEFKSASSYDVRKLLTIGSSEAYINNGLSAKFYTLPKEVARTTTDASGNYSLTALSRLYRVKPSAAAYTFSPAERNISTPASGQNFTVIASPPLISDVPNQIMDEDTTLDVAFSVSDLQTLGSSLSVMASSSNPSVPSSSIILSGTGGARSARITPPYNANGTTTITLTVTDASGLSASDSFQLTVNPLNDAPVVGIGTALQFTGAQTINVPAFPSPGAAVTIEFWVYIDELRDQSILDLSPGDQANRISVYALEAVGGVMRFFYGNEVLDCPILEGTGSWQHFALVADKSANNGNGRMAIYRNGLKVAEKATSDAFDGGNYALVLGQNFKGKLAEFRLWKQARTESQMQQARSMPLLGTETDLVLYYRFLEQSGPYVFDTARASGQNGSQDGSIVGSGSSWVTNGPVLAVPVDEDAARSIPLPAFDPEGSLLTYTIVTNPQHGSVTMSGGVAVYTPVANYNGPDSFIYRVSDGSLNSATATVNLSVNDANDIPVISSIGNQTSEEDRTFGPLQFTVTDPDSASIAVSARSSDPLIVDAAGIVITPAPGSPGTRALTIQPKPGESGTVTITLTAFDGTDSSERSFELRIQPKPAYAVFDLGELTGRPVTAAMGLNDLGHVVGSSAQTESGTASRAFFFNGIENGGRFSELPTFGGTGQAVGINNFGFIVGQSSYSDGRLRGFRSDGTILTDLGTLTGGTMSQALAINDNGLIAGFAGTSGAAARRAFLFGGTLTNLGTLPSPFNSESFAYGLNTSNHVVGAATDPAGNQRAFFYNGATMTALANSANNAAYGINRFGRVAGVSSAVERPGYAVSLSGAGEHAAAPGGIYFNTNFTVEAWVFVKSLRSWARLMDFAQGPAQNNIIVALSAETTGKPALYIYQGGTTMAVVSTQTLPLNQWVHLAAVLDGASGSIYINGVQTGAGAMWQPLPVLRTNNFIGKSNWESDATADAIFDDIRIWNVARTGEEIRAGMVASPSDAAPGSLVHWRLDEGLGNIASGAGSQPASLTLKNGAGWTKPIDTGVNRAFVMDLPAATDPTSVAALNFDGADDLATASGIDLANKSFTIEFWARRARTGIAEFLLSQGSEGGSAGLHLGFRSSDTFTFAFWGNDFETSQPNRDTLWHHWAVSHDAASKAQVIYRDGVQVATRTAPQNFIGTGLLRLGQYLASVESIPFRGSLDELRIWSVVRSEQQVRAAMFTGPGPAETGLLAWWRLDEGAGTTASATGSVSPMMTLANGTGWTTVPWETAKRAATLQSLGSLQDKAASEARVVNDFGQIVGTAQRDGQARAFLHTAGTMYDLNDVISEQDAAVWKLQKANAINARGEIAGIGLYNGSPRAFLAVPANLIGRKVVRPEGALATLPEIELLRSNPGDTPDNAFFFSQATRKLYAIRPVTARLKWFISENPVDTNRINNLTVNIWPRNPQTHIANAPVEVQPPGNNYSFFALLHSTTPDAKVDTGSKVFNASGPGYSVLGYMISNGQSPDPTIHAPFFAVARTFNWNDPVQLLDNQPAVIGQAVTSPFHQDYPKRNGWVYFEKAFYDGAGPDRAHDRAARTGPIIPVNRDKSTTDQDDLVMVWYKIDGIGVAWAYKPVRYAVAWPVNPPEIVIASQLGSGILDDALMLDRRVYYQPDPSLPGYNPNEEHAFLAPANGGSGEALFALRDDLNSVVKDSEPYSLLKYKDPNDVWNIKVFKVLRENALYKFHYGTRVEEGFFAGKEIQPPYPVSLLNLCERSYGVSGPFWEDHNGKIYAKAAGLGDSLTDDIVIRYFYPLQLGFYYDLDKDGVPDTTIGTCLPWLDRRDGGKKDEPINVTYTIRWPESSPLLEIGDTLTTAKNGLPGVRNWAAADVIYDTVNPAGGGILNAAARLYDPLTPRTIKIPLATNILPSTAKSFQMPAVIKRSNVNGQEYFTDLPFDLRVRLAYDPINRWLSFGGYEYDDGSGEPLLLVNIMSDAERKMIQGLDGDNQTDFNKVVDALYDLTRNPNNVDVDGDHFPDKALRVGLITQYWVKDGSGTKTSFEAPLDPKQILSSQVVLEPLLGPKAVSAGIPGTTAPAFHPGNALNLDGIESSASVVDYVNAGSAINLANQSFTMEFWANRKSLGTSDAAIRHGTPGARGYLYVGFGSGNQFIFDFSGDGVTTGSYTVVNEWHHWACTFDADTRKQIIYRDGRVEIQGTVGGNYVGAGPLTIGAGIFPVEQFEFHGQLDDVRIWTIARSGDSIRNDMGKRLLGTEPGLVRYFRFDEASGNTVIDSSSAGANGTFVHSPSRVASTAKTGLAPRFVTLAENNDGKLGLPVTLHVIRVEDGPFPGDMRVIFSDNVFDEKVTLRQSADFGGDPQQFQFEWYYKPSTTDFDRFDLPVVDDTGSVSNPKNWILHTPPVARSPDRNSIVIGGGGESSLLTMSDNWWIMRYKGYNVNGSTNWSDWIGNPADKNPPGAQFVPGWVKRVVTGLNPFEARTTNFHASAAQTFSSMLIEAGPRYEGAIAFNGSPENLKSIGLIEAYSTVLDRARNLSIDGAPAVNFEPANSALLLASSRIADLYTLLGNEAFADAEDPTIGFTTDSTHYKSLATSIFAFQNQLDSPLEEELTLLRGRDDGAVGVQGAPAYNRLYWNFTSGDGEVAYAQTYNISDQNGDGVIDERDARILFPQGHGDAWGHYLTAMTTYYTLLRHPNFVWLPRAETVLVAGTPILVDFLDERKFASIAAQKAKTGARITDLTYRLNWVDDPAGQWQGYKDDDADRAWGVTEWARRAGVGAYFDWLTVNAILPAEDTNPAHIGIQKIDRTTVAEIAEIAAQVNAVQAQLDQADGGLNPVGLAKGVVPFDIDPALVTAGQTHFEQIQGRALQALNNTVMVWNQANELSEQLRRTQDSVEQFTHRVDDQERDYKNRLIEIFGYPHAGDIGTAKTYPNNYDGPDLYHWMYINTAEVTGESAGAGSVISGYYNRLSQVSQTGLNGNSFYFDRDVNNAALGTSSNSVLKVDYPLSVDDFAFSAPLEWGQRRAPGEIQLALSDAVQQETRIQQALLNYNNLVKKIEDAVSLLEARHGLSSANFSIRNDTKNEKAKYGPIIGGLKATIGVLAAVKNRIKNAMEATIEGIPKVVGFATDATAPARGAIRLAANSATTIPSAVSAALEASVGILEGERNSIQIEADIELATLADRFAVEQQIAVVQGLFRDIASQKLEVQNQAEILDQTVGRFMASLARGQRLIEERVAYRQRVAAQTQETRYQDMAFRVFRNDALQKYRAQFDLAARYVFLAATAYDYETSLLGGDRRSGRAFLTDIVRHRSLGQIEGGQPVAGIRGLADPLARLSQNFNVLKPQLGFNNPQTETGRFSVRSELFRLQSSSDAQWREVLTRHRVANLWDLPEFRRFCRPFAPESTGPQPGIVIRFPSTVTFSENFFGWPLGGGDSGYDPTLFATKIRSVGVWFTAYNGTGLSVTPRVYMIPAGADVLRSPDGNDFGQRYWRVVDQKLPVPFQIGFSDFHQEGWIPVNDSLGGSFAEIRRFSSFRAYHDSGFSTTEMTVDSRLIGRSVCNTDWILIIPGGTLLNNASQGLDTFINSVGDIKLFFQTYSYSGN